MVSASTLDTGRLLIVGVDEEIGRDECVSAPLARAA